MERVQKVSLGDKIKTNTRHVQTYVKFDQARSTAPAAYNQEKVIAALEGGMPMAAQQIAAKVCHRAVHTSVRGYMNGLPLRTCLA